jgi:hypothetical protein
MDMKLMFGAVAVLLMGVAQVGLAIPTVECSLNDGAIMWSCESGAPVKYRCNGDLEQWQVVSATANSYNCPTSDVQSEVLTADTCAEFTSDGCAVEEYAFGVVTTAKLFHGTSPVDLVFHNQNATPAKALAYKFCTVSGSPGDTCGEAASFGSTTACYVALSTSYCNFEE